MRYKPRPEKKPELHPIKIDASDLEHILELAGNNATLRIETKRCEYDGPEDLVRNLHWRGKLTRLDVVYDKHDRFTIVPHLEVYGTRAAKIAPKIEQFLYDNRRRPIVLYGLIIGATIWYWCSVAIPLLYHSGAGDLDASHFNPFGGNWFVALSMGWPAYFVATMLIGNVVVPRKRDGSWARQHLPTLAVGIVCAVVGAVAAAIFT